MKIRIGCIQCELRELVEDIIERYQSMLFEIDTHEDNIKEHATIIENSIIRSACLPFTKRSGILAICLLLKGGQEITKENIVKILNSTQSMDLFKMTVKSPFFEEAKKLFKIMRDNAYQSMVEKDKLLEDKNDSEEIV